LTRRIFGETIGLPVSRFQVARVGDPARVGDASCPTALPENRRIISSAALEPGVRRASFVLGDLVSSLFFRMAVQYSVHSRPWAFKIKAKIG